jgi:undecaprenyl phosphate-alpha-L-ara4N flippase subunit ArnE
MESRMARINKLSIGIFLMLICTIFTASGQFFLKKGTENLSLNLDIIYNYSLILGILFYGIGALVLIFALKFGKLNVLYPIVSLTYVWVILISFFILNEQILLKQIFGIGFILMGVFFITKGGKK